MARLTSCASQGDPVTQSVRLTNFALDETSEGTVLRGVLDPSTLGEIQVDKYQREVISQSGKKRGLIAAMRRGDRVPDVELGMRGEDFEFDGEDVIVLKDPTYVVDGLQRISSAKVVLSEGEVVPHIGATIYFKTTQEWERKRFDTLNQDRERVSSNIILRNKEDDIPAVAELIRLTKSDRAFVMYGRVSWSQQMNKGELVTALTFAKVIGRLHIHLGPTGQTEVEMLAQGLNTTMLKIGKNVFRDNVKTFFDIIDRMYGIKLVTYTRGAIYMRNTFLLALAKLFSSHTDFWRGNRFFVEAPLANKLKTFPLNDPQVLQLASSGGKAIDMLYYLLVEHVNNGKRTKRLTSRNYIPVAVTEGQTQESEEEGEEQSVA